MDKKAEIQVRKIAEAIYIKHRDKGLHSDPARDWKEAEALYRNKFKYYPWWLYQLLYNFHYEILASAAIISIFMSSCAITVNKDSTDLNIRPYVSVDMEYPKKFVNNNDTFYGNNIVLTNKGKIPAAKVSTQYYITSDLDKENMNGLVWFNENLGGFGSISFVIPNDPKIEPGFRSLSPAAQYYYFEAITSYEGIELNRKYWTHVRKVFFIDKAINQLFPVKIYGEWDRNKNSRPPLLSTKEQVVNLLDEIKKNKK